jgi:acyl carrier protein
MDAAGIEDWLIARVARELDRAPEEVDPELPFATLGLDSTVAVSISGELEERLGIRIDPTAVFEYPTIRRLAGHLAEGREAP